MMMPPSVIHNHTIVYEDVDTHLRTECTHEDYHHRDDTEHDKNTKHHHHCTIEISVLTVFPPVDLVYDLKHFVFQNIKANYYKHSHTTSFVGRIFHPPKF